MPLNLNPTRELKILARLNTAPLQKPPSSIPVVLSQGPCSLEPQYYGFTTPYYGRDWPGNLAQAFLVMRSVTEGVAFAHKCGVIHRDLKKDNIAYKHALGQAVILDWEHAITVDEARKKQQLGLQCMAGTDCYEVIHRHSCAYCWLNNFLQNKRADSRND